MGVAPLMMAIWLVAQTPAAPGGSVAVLDVSVTSIDETLSPILTEVLTSHVHKSRYFSSVISGRDIAAMLGFERQKQMVGCGDQSCLAEIGGALGVDRLIVSQAGKLGDTFIVTLKLINIDGATTERRVYKTIKGGGVDRLIDTVAQSVAELIPGATAPPPAAVAQPAPEQNRSGGVGVAPIVLWAIGGVGVASGIGFGLKAQSHANHANDATLVGAQREIGPGKSSMILSNISYGVGAASAAIGVLIWLLSGDDDAATADVTTTPNAVMVRF